MTAACQASLSLTISWTLPKFMCVESVIPSYHVILCHPLLLLPSIFPSIRVFSSESALCIRWLKQWTFSFDTSHSNKYSGLISLRIDWLISLLSRDSQEPSPPPEFESINSSVISLLCGPALTSVHDYWTNHSSGYTDLCWQVMSLLFNTLSRFMS